MEEVQPIFSPRDFLDQFKTYDEFFAHTEGNLAFLGVHMIEGTPQFVATVKVTQEWQEYMTRNIAAFGETPPIIRFNKSGVVNKSKLKKELRAYIRNGLLGKNNKDVRTIFGDMNVYVLMKEASTMNLANLIVVVYGTQVFEYVTLIENLHIVYPENGGNE